MSFLLRSLALLACLALAGALVAAVWTLPPRPADLGGEVLRRLAESGVRHPVTAVLLNFRGYDTLLEVAVLLLAGIGLLAGAGPGIPGLRLCGAQASLKALARRLAPAMVITAGYLLWMGAHAPGGAFQAAAVLGAAGVLLGLSGIVGTWTAPPASWRLVLVAGLLVFLAVSAASLPAGVLLRYPPHAAGTLILLIEATLTLSLALLLAGLFLWQPNEHQTVDGWTRP